MWCISKFWDLFYPFSALIHMHKNCHWATLITPPLNFGFWSIFIPDSTWILKLCLLSKYIEAFTFIRNKQYTFEYCLYHRIHPACYYLINGVLPHIYMHILKANSHGNLKSPVTVKKNAKNIHGHHPSWYIENTRKEGTFYSLLVRVHGPRRRCLIVQFTWYTCPCLDSVGDIPH